MEVAMTKTASSLVRNFKNKWNQDIKNNVEKTYEQIVEEFQIDWEKASLAEKQQIVEYLTETISKYWYAIICEAEKKIFSNSELMLKYDDNIWINYAEAIRIEDGFTTINDD
jgi:hypothetical protein